ncbi:hypothetical protein HNY73_013526 [Argiope bruennichi]|uniref:Uncharacterized protein n=1 Tax=Argiope bruennichi TaxID=94029 RepID=A0A8T0EYB7_ARGBR|nr:hypothetical protein HNY73_013526 [Argiope bruennichi]
MNDSMETSMVYSKHEENLENEEDPNVKSDNEKCESPSQKSGIEPSKPRRRGRRGKRRKQRKDSSAVCENEAHGEHEAGESNDWKSDEDLDSKLGSYMDTVMVRPINVPKAPENYNTFIMDEHDECHLYMSFETPNPYMANTEELRDQNCAITEPFEDAAYIDIDYEYESPQDFDNVAYYDKEFEESYKNNRFDELVRLSREELIAGIQDLERRLRELSEDLVRENPSPVLEKLQAELLELQEKHLELKECNARLTALVMDSETGSAPGESPANSQTLTDGFSPQSDLVSPSHTIESKCELVLSEQSPRKGWSPYSPADDRRSQGDMPYIEDDSVLFSRTSDVLKVDSTDVNVNTESVLSAKDGECWLSPTSDFTLKTSDIKVENSLNSSEEGESQNLKHLSESGYDVDKKTFKSDLVHNPKLSPKEMSNNMSTLEELNSVTV